jgi:hypothetical protein
MRKQRDYIDLHNLSTRLKILRRVTLSCQFKSGPGHHFRNKSHTYLKNRLQGYSDNIGHVSTPVDASMMWAVRCG